MQAALHFEQEQYDKALVLAQEILRMRPRFAPAVMLAAMTHLARGEPNQAENLLRPLVQSQPKDLAARRLYATALLQMGNAKGALETLAPALAQSNDDPALLTLAADAYARLKDFTKATAYYEQAAKLEPDRTELLARAGLARFAGGDETQGLATLESAAARSADSLGADTALFSLLLKQQEFEKALAVARNIQSKAAENPIGYNLAGLALLRLKDTAAARKSFERAAQLDPSYWPAAANLVRMELATGEKAAAQARIERVLSKDRSNVEAASALMQVTGDRGQFVRSLEAARQDDPKALALRLVLVEAYLEKGLADHALPIAREAVAIAPQSNEALALLGSAQLAAGRHGESLNTFRELVVRLPASSQAQVRLAGAQAALNELSGAESAYRKALTMKPGDAESLAGLARLYGRQKRFDEALKLAAELRAAQPKAAIGHALAGDLYLGARRHPEAIQAYEAAFSLRPSGDLVVKRHAARLAAGEQPGNTNLIQWLDTHPDDLMVRLHLANQHYRAGAFRDAITEYAAIVKADPNHAFALNNLASAFLKLNDKRALSVAEAAHQLKPDHASILDTLGVAQMRYGDAAAAVDTLKKAIARQPEVAEFRVNYALALARSGEKAAARAELQKVLVSSKGLVLEPEAKALLETR